MRGKVMTLEEALDLLGSIQLLSVTKHRAEKLLVAVDAAVAAEREACAKIAERIPGTGEAIAREIRRRSQREEER
jgi:hypothetical protein